MSNSKIGRNSPCPCGSGKKYKNCCMALEEAAGRNTRPFDQYSQLIATIKVKLDQHYKAQIRKVRKPLQEQFMRLCTAPLPQEQESVFSDWLWFDAIDSEGVTMGEEYLRENADYMDASMRQCLQGLNASYLSLFEAIAMEADNLRVRDLITGREESVMLRGPLDQEIIEKRPLLCGRLVRMPQGAIFSGIVLILINDAGQAEFITNHIQYLQHLKPDQDTETLLRNHGEILFGIFEHTSHGAALNLNDVRVLRLGDAGAAPISILGQSPDFRPTHAAGGIRWYDLGDKQGNARIGAGAGFIVAYAGLLHDLLRLEDCLNTLFPGGDWEVVSSLFRFQSPAPEFEDIWYKVIKDQETERWLHTVHHELDDRTPAEILTEGRGRERLGAMLDSFKEQASGNQYSEDLINYMRERISQ
ncbi:MAG: SEC-C metal-binding domain-containing protein [Syntrophomonadaceae bacterium]|nr:SEC-C metal-binding domain-containing protein [Syntrophomonadaceae bacterium]